MIFKLYNNKAVKKKKKKPYLQTLVMLNIQKKLSICIIFMTGGKYVLLKTITVNLIFQIKMIRNLLETDLSNLK